MAEKRGATVKDVSAADFVSTYAAHLKRTGKIVIPAWLDLVKTGIHKELPPYDADWYYIRCASIARQIYLKPGLGVGMLKFRYGGKSRNGTAPDHHVNGSGSVVRTVLRNLKKIKVVEKITDGKGHFITIDGQRDLDSIATQIVSHVMDSFMNFVEKKEINFETFLSEMVKKGEGAEKRKPTVHEKLYNIDPINKTNVPKKESVPHIQSYKSTNNQQESIEKAITWRNKDLEHRSLQDAQKKFGIPKSTLYRHSADSDINSRTGPSPIFSYDMEKMMLLHAEQSADCGEPLTSKEFLEGCTTMMRLTYDDPSLPPLSYGFLKAMEGRHPNSLIPLKARLISEARAASLTPEQLDPYYHNWDAVVNNMNDPDNIVLLDESIVHNGYTPQKHLSGKKKHKRFHKELLIKKKHGGKRTSQFSTTMVISASGKLRAIALNSRKGTIHKDTIEAMKRILPDTTIKYFKVNKPRKGQKKATQTIDNDPLLWCISVSKKDGNLNKISAIAMDGPSTHSTSVVLNAAKKFNVIIQWGIANATRWLQSLDHLLLFGTVKRVTSYLCQRTHEEGKDVDINRLAILFAYASKVVFTKERILQANLECGQYPVSLEQMKLRCSEAFELTRTSPKHQQQKMRVEAQSKLRSAHGKQDELAQHISEIASLEGNDVQTIMNSLKDARNQSQENKGNARFSISGLNSSLPEVQKHEEMKEKKIGEAKSRKEEAEKKKVEKKKEKEEMDVKKAKEKEERMQRKRKREAEVEVKKRQRMEETERKKADKEKMQEVRAKLLSEKLKKQEQENEMTTCIECGGMWNDTTSHGWVGWFGCDRTMCENWICRMCFTHVVTETQKNAWKRKRQAYMCPVHRK